MIICCNGNKYLGYDGSLFNEEQDIWHIEGYEGEMDLETAIETKAVIYIYRLNTKGIKHYLYRFQDYRCWVNQYAVTPYTVDEDGSFYSSKYHPSPSHSDIAQTMCLMNSDPFSYVLK